MLQHNELVMEANIMLKHKLRDERAMRKHRGFSLIEMLVVITVSAALLGICTSILHLLMRSERAGRDHLHQATSAARLARQFRNDVHAAITPPAPGDAARPGWRFELAPGQTVVYRIEPGRVDRTEWERQKLRRQESYDLPAGDTARIEPPGHQRPATACLLLPQANRAELRVEAVVGRDHRFAGDERRSEK